MLFFSLLKGRLAVPCLGYVVEEAASRRSFGQHERDMLQANSTALQAQGINPMSLLGKLQRGSQPIPLPDGSTLEPPPFSRPGVRLTPQSQDKESS